MLGSPHSILREIKNPREQKERINRKEIQETLKHMKICLTSFILREIEIQTKSEVEYHFVLTDGISQKDMPI